MIKRNWRWEKVQEPLPSPTGRHLLSHVSELKPNGWIRPNTLRCPGRSAVAGGYRAEVANKRAQAYTAKSHAAAPETRKRIVGSYYALSESRPFAGANCWHTGACEL